MRSVEVKRVWNSAGLINNCKQAKRGYKVQVGAFRQLSNAIKMEQKLRKFRYNTYIVYS